MECRNPLFQHHKYKLGSNQTKLQNTRPTFNQCIINGVTVLSGVTLWPFLSIFVQKLMLHFSTTHDTIVLKFSDFDLQEISFLDDA